jgi:hypothetical protein
MIDDMKAERLILCRASCFSILNANFMRLVQSAIDLLAEDASPASLDVVAR